MNHAPSQLRSTFRRSPARVSWDACAVTELGRTASAISSPINSPQLPVRDRDRILGVLTPGAIGGEHVEHDEVGDRGGGLLPDRTEPASGERALGGVAERRAFG